MLTSTGISKTTSQNKLNFGDKIEIPTDNLDERLQRVKPLCYPPANPIRGKSSFYWSSERHSELSRYPQGRNVNDVTNEGKS